MITECEPFRVWSRLEPRPRQSELGDVLQAKIQDALWLFARQWQFGEFAGTDGGSPIVATLARTTSPVVAVSTGGGAQVGYDPTRPLEAQVEKLPIDFPAALRAQIGRVAAQLIAAALGADIDSVTHALASVWPLAPAQTPPPGDVVATARAGLTGLGGRVHAALAGRAVDGVALAQAQRQGQTTADLPAAVAALGNHGRLLDALAEVHTWFVALYQQPPSTDDGWDGTRLEYEYAIAVNRPDGGLSLRGAPTCDGRVDWYAMDVAGAATVPPAAPEPTSEVLSVIPGQVTYSGMPKKRLWEMEDGSVALGAMRADSTDLAKIVVTDFALVYGNDWFAIPHRQSIGTLTEIAGIVVTDVFGRKILVRAATGGAGADWAAWDLFSVSPAVASIDPLGQHLFLPPALPPTRPGPTMEEVSFVRDDAATMAWAIETVVPDGLGGGRDGGELARQLSSALLEPAAGAAPPGLSYVLGTSVPENWIPFVPVQTGDDTHSIRLQRAWMPRAAPRGSRVRPVTAILRSGIAADDSQTAPYFVDEEEVPKSGVRISAAMRRARWTDGSTVVWYGRRVSPGHGEGNSGLRFDDTAVNPTAPGSGA